jgi:hypothetical protein
MTILSIVGALVLDFLFLPALLFLGRKKEQPETADDTRLLPSTA